MTYLHHILHNEQHGFVIVDSGSYATGADHALFGRTQPAVKRVAAALVEAMVSWAQRQALPLKISNDELLESTVNQRKAFLFVSLAVASDPADSDGIRTLYFGTPEGQVSSAVGKPLAECIDEAVRHRLGVESHGEVATDASLFERIAAPVVRIEIANAADQRDGSRLLDATGYLQPLGEAIAAGIATFQTFGSSAIGVDRTGTRVGSDE